MNVIPGRLALDDARPCLRGLPSPGAGPSQMAGWQHGRWHPVLGSLDGLANNHEHRQLPAHALEQLARAACFAGPTALRPWRQVAPMINCSCTVMSDPHCGNFSCKGLTSFC